MLRKRYRAASLILLASLVAGLSFWGLRNKDPYVSQAPPQLPAPPLKELAERSGISIGSFASLKYLRERPYSEILSQQFDYAIIDGEPNWKFEDFTLRPSREEFDFDHIDQVFSFADQWDMPVRYQHLLWGDDKWLPEWLKQGNYSSQELEDIIKEHIDTVVARYKGKVREYTVVNEAFSRKLLTGGNHDWWGERLGYDYIDNAFRWAHAADPQAVLILNDFGNETEGEISNLMYEYVKAALQRGVPIQGIGMQMHIDATNVPERAKVVANMKRFHDLGLKIYITEFDVNMHGLEKDKQQEDEIQADIYGDLLGACLDAGADVCPNFGFLGLIDRQSWYRGIGLEDANPLLFNEDYSPKPAFFTVRTVLEARSNEAQR